MPDSHAMRRFSVFALFLSLLMQLAMPAMAMLVPQAASLTEHSGHHSQETHEQKPQTPHCPLAMPGCNMAICIICTALAPLIAAAETPSLNGGAPAPDLVQPMPQSAPRPLLPPPRA